MTTDIVERLRESPCEPCRFDRCFDECICGLEKITNEAADEIERLRAIVERFERTTQDGVAVYPGDDVWQRIVGPRGGIKSCLRMAFFDGCAYEVYETEEYSFLALKDGAVVTMDCYSTREAAEQAAKRAAKEDTQ